MKQLLNLPNFFLYKFLSPKWRNRARISQTFRSVSVLFHISIILTVFDCSFISRLVFLLNIVELVSELEDSLRRVEVILIQQPGLTANLKDIQHQIKVLQVQLYMQIITFYRVIQTNLWTVV